MRRHTANHLVSLSALSPLLVACVVSALLVPGAASGSREAAKAGQLTQLTLFSVATKEQFLNHVDDRQRGYGNNPFGNFKAATATTRESNGGPFPGDQALFQFNLYSGADLKKLAGTADFTCSYSFKRNGFCDAVYQLSLRGRRGRDLRRGERESHRDEACRDELHGLSTSLFPFPETTECSRQLRNFGQRARLRTSRESVPVRAL